MNIADLIAKVVKASNPREGYSAARDTELRSSQMTRKHKGQSQAETYSAHVSATIPCNHGDSELQDGRNPHQLKITKTIVTTVIPKNDDEDEIGSESSSTRYLKK